ncbi:MAG: tetratricopeptide repeat protein [Planctomycetes bacterium]|nr:tetratricopeptide repeat protein [Planctomycetota bacterium]
MKPGMRAAALALALAASVSAFGSPDAPVDPLDPLRPALARQDELAEKKQWDTIVNEARAKAKDGTPEALYLLGRALGNVAVVRKSEGKEDDARRLLLESERCFQDAKESGIVVFPPAYLGLARCARSRGDLDTAAAQLRAALKIAPGFKAAAIDLAQVCAQKGAGAEAEFILRQQLEVRPGDPEIRILLGMIKLAQGRAGEAEQEFRAVVKAFPDNAPSRKLLASALIAQRNYAEAAQHLDAYVRMDPKDDEAYRVLFLSKMKLKDRQGAQKVLEVVRRELPGTEAAQWAEAVGADYAKDPESFETADERTPQALARKLDSKDSAVVLQALSDMRAIQWPALPSAVYRLLAPAAAGADVRRAAVRLIGDQKDPRTLTVLEILLFHPKEQDPSQEVRREVAKAIAGLPSAAIIPVLYRAIDQGDIDVRESAVKGIATATGKYFREKLEVATDAAAWPAERQLYDNWWRSAGGSLAKRDALALLAKIFEPIQQGRKRLAEYTLAALEDADARTWRAGYDLFRSLTAQDFGAATGEPDTAERSRIAQACRSWFYANGNKD